MGPQRPQHQWVPWGLISLANPNSPLSITSAPIAGGGWQPGWQGPPGWPGTANALTHDTHVPARGKAIGGERGCRSPKYPSVPDTGDYRFADGTIAQPGLSRLPAKHKTPPKTSAFTFPPATPCQPPDSSERLQGARHTSRAAGIISSWFFPKLGFSQSIGAKCIV